MEADAASVWPFDWKVPSAILVGVASGWFFSNFSAIKTWFTSNLPAEETPKAAKVATEHTDVGVDDDVDWRGDTDEGCKSIYPSHDDVDWRGDTDEGCKIIYPSHDEVDWRGDTDEGCGEKWGVLKITGNSCEVDTCTVFGQEAGKVLSKLQISSVEHLAVNEKCPALDHCDASLSKKHKVLKHEEDEDGGEGSSEEEDEDEDEETDEEEELHDEREQHDGETSHVEEDLDDVHLPQPPVGPVLNDVHLPHPPVGPVLNDVDSAHPPVLNDVDSAHPPFDPVANLAGKKIKLLTVVHLEKFADLNCGVSGDDWQRLAHRIVEVEIPQGDARRHLLEQIKQCELAYFGGGSAAKAFLLELRKKTIYVSKFVEVATSIKRNDVVSYINKKGLLKNEDGTDILFEDVSLEHIDALAGKLDGQNKVHIKNWTAMAGRMDFTDDEISELKQVKPAPDEFSPTNKLFKLLNAELPDLTLRDIHNALEHIGRRDLANYVKQEFNN